MVRTALRTLLLLVSLISPAYGQEQTRHDNAVRRFGELLKRDEILPFNELASGSVWLMPWQPLRFAILAYEAIDLASIAITGVRETASGAEVDVRICATGISDGRRNAPRQALPDRWTLTFDDHGKIAAVTYWEEGFARRLNALTSDDERCRLIAREPVATPVLIPLLMPRDRNSAQSAGAERQTAFALSLAQSIGSPSAEVGVWGMRAYVARLNGRLQESLQFAQRAKAIATRSERPYDWERAATSLGHAFRLTERYDEAIAEYVYAKSLFGQADLAVSALEADLSLGSTVRLRGEYAAAIEHQERVLRLAPELDMREAEALAWMNIGALYMEMNYDEAARALLREAVDRLGHMNSANVRVAKANLGNLEKRVGNHDLAMKLFREVVATPEGRESVGGVLAAQALADIHMTRGELAEARAILDVAVPIARRIAGRRSFAVVRRTDAALMIREGRFEEARDAAAESTRILDEVNDLYTSVESRTHYARALYCMGQVDEAVKQLRRAAEDMERLPAPISFDREGRARFFEDKQETYEYLTAILAEQGRVLEALEASEAMKARVLRSVHGGDPADESSLDPLERQRRKTIEDEIRDTNRRLATARGTDRRLLEERLFRKRRELQEFFARLTTLHDRRAHVPVPDVVVPQGAVFVSFVVGESTTTILVAENRGGGMRFNRQLVTVERKELERQVTKFTDALSRRDLAVDREGERLYRLLISPIESLVPRGATICILPDGALWRIPFHALRTPRRDRYLLDEHPVFYAPSLRMLALARERQVPANAKRQLVAFGDPARRAADGMPRLPEAEQEVEALRALYGAARTRAFTGAAATESVFKREARGAHVLHIATHGIVDDRAPMYSALLFAEEPRASSEDGRLEAREVLDLDLGADIAVLSACDTARGHIGAGEGVIGLSWAFLIAGCPTTVVSHWKAESRITKEVMTAFHAALLQGRSKVEALRIAQLRQRKNGFAHPFYWAPFVVLGAP